jgi:GT2 family glycosyltransferase
LLFLNNDIEIIDEMWLDELVQWAQLPEIGAVGAQLIFPNFTIQHNGIVIGMGGHADHLFYNLPINKNTIFGSIGWYRNVSAVTGACMMMRKDVFYELGGFDESYQLVFSDIEICMRALKKGYRNLVNPFSRLIHHEGKSRGKYIPQGDIGIAYTHLKSWVAKRDPYYHPSLSLAVNYPTFLRSFEPNPLDRLENIVKYYSNDPENI